MTEEVKKILDLLKYCVEKNEYLEVTNMKEWEPLLNYITNLQKENEDYKQRNEKAVEYIEERKNLNWYADGVFVYELLNILNGGDE